VESRDTFQTTESSSILPAMISESLVGQDGLPLWHVNLGNVRLFALKREMKNRERLRDFKFKSDSSVIILFYSVPSQIMSFSLHFLMS
jgi:hypothetical protein